MSPTLFQVFINDLLEVVEAVRKGVKVGDTETTVSGILFTDDFVGVSDTPEGLQLQIDAAKKFTDKLRLSANVKKSAVMVCNEDREEPVEYRWKWGIEEIAVVDQYTYLGVEIAKDCSWNAHIHVQGSGKRQSTSREAAPNTRKPAPRHTHQIDGFKERNRTAARVRRRSMGRK